MIRNLLGLLLTAVPLASVMPQQPEPAHRWAPVVTQTDVRIDLDTVRIKSTDHRRRVWLRWTFPTAAPDFADIQIEGRDIDCAHADTRIMSTQDVTVFDGAPSVAPVRIVNDSTGPWIHPSRGSLEDLVVSAVCRWRTAGA